MVACNFHVPASTLVKLVMAVPKMLVNAPPTAPPKVSPYAPPRVPTLVMFRSPPAPATVLSLPKVIKPA